MMDSQVGQKSILIQKKPRDDIKSGRVIGEKVDKKITMCPIK